jgi:16S rRNA pseudouridine516 synthase
VIDQLLAGVQVHDEPAPLKALTCIQRGAHQLEIVLEQGKYHQVKRMLAAAGNHCLALHRSAIGGITLKSLGIAEGEWCYLDQAPLELLA